MGARGGSQPPKPLVRFPSNIGLHKLLGTPLHPKGEGPSWPTSPGEDRGSSAPARLADWCSSCSLPVSGALEVHPLKVFRGGGLGLISQAFVLQWGLLGQKTLQTFLLPGSDPTGLCIAKILETCRGRVVLWLATWLDCLSSEQALLRRCCQQPSPSRPVSLGRTSLQLIRGQLVCTCGG